MISIYRPDNKSEYNFAIRNFQLSIHSVAIVDCLKRLSQLRDSTGFLNVTGFPFKLLHHKSKELHFKCINNFNLSKVL